MKIINRKNKENKENTKNTKWSGQTNRHDGNPLTYLSHLSKSLFFCLLLATAAYGKGPVRPLGGQVNQVMVFNSNCPEVVLREGILLSTFSPLGKDVPENHLDYRFKGDFAIFMHHINKQKKETSERTLFLNLIAHNPDKEPATVTISSQATYCTRPDAPFYERPALALDNENKLYSGPGDRVCSDFVHQTEMKDLLKKTVGPGETVILSQIPVSVEGLESALNGRSFYALGNVDGAVELANIATFGKEPPELPELKKMIQASLMARPREYEKMPPSRKTSKGRFIYGRVCGVQKGAEIRSHINLVLKPGKKMKASYPISTLPNGTFGTKDCQSLPLIRRYDDTAYSAHGNYCVRYLLLVEARNDDQVKRTVAVTFDSPVKSDKNELAYLDGNKSMFYRGAVKLTADRDQRETPEEQYFHLTLHKGEKLSPICRYELNPRETRMIEFELYYPPDATPPQVLTFESEN